MAGQRKRCSADFKSKVVLEAIRSELTITQLVAKHGVHQTLIHGWKKQALEEAMAGHGKPEIFNTDQGSRFTSPRFTGILTGAGVRVSMGGRGRRMDNVFIERLWRPLKHECVYIRAFETGSEARARRLQIGRAHV